MGLTQTGTPCTDGNQEFFVDLTGDASGTWNSPNNLSVNIGDTCCGVAGCIEFKILVHPDADAVALNILSGSAGTYSWKLESGLTCTGPVSTDDAFCIAPSTSDTIYITFCQAGTYRFQVESFDPQINLTAIEFLAEGCDITLSATLQDIDPTTLVWTTLDVPAATYLGYLDATTGTPTVTMTVPKGSTVPGDATIDYRLSGRVTATCPAVSADVAVIISPAPNITINPPTTFCPEDPYTVTANPGPGSYEYNWYNAYDGSGAGSGWSTSTSFTFGTVGQKSVIVRDPNNMALGFTTCAYDTVNFDLTLFPTPPANITGPVVPICTGVSYGFSTPSAGAGAIYAWEFREYPSGTVITNIANNRTPNLTFNTCGDKQAVVTVTSNDGCDSTISLVFQADSLAPDLTGCTLPEPIFECAGTAANNAAILAWHNANIALLDLPTSCVTDDCNWTVTSDFNPGNFVVSCGSAGAITVIYTVDDGCFQSQVSATFTIEDNTPPSTTDPDLNNMSFQCVAAVPPVESSITMNDACGTTSFNWLGDSPAGPPCALQITRQYELIDACNNRDTVSQIFTINDVTNPTISCGPVIAIEGCGIDDVDGPETGNLEFSPGVRNITLAQLQAVGGNAGDNCGIDSLYYRDIQNGSCPITITRTYTVVDSCGNRNSCSQTITVDDTTPPTITAPADIDVEGCVILDIFPVSGLAYSPASVTIPVATFTGLGGGALVGDNCAVLDVSYSDVVTTDACEYVVTRTFVVRDTCLNEAQDVQQIRIADLTNPTITCPDAIDTDGCNTTEILGLSGLDYSTSLVVIDSTTFVNLPSSVAVPAVDDNCGIMSVTYQDFLLPPTCPVVVMVRRDFIVTDSCGNTATCSQSIVLRDVTAPTITCPADISIEGCDELDVLALTGYAFSVVPVNLTEAQYDAYGNGASADDNCGTVSVRYQDQVIQAQCPTIVHRTFTAFDPCNNLSVQCVQVLTVNDTTRPVINCPGHINVTCIEDIPAPYSNFSAFTAAGGSASDCHINTDSFSFVADSIVSGGSCRDIERYYRIVDDCGNESFCIQTIAVNDNQAPTLSGIPPDVNITCDSCIQSFQNGDFEFPPHPDPNGNFGPNPGVTPNPGSPAAANPPGLNAWGGRGGFGGYACPDGFHPGTPRWVYWHENWVPGWATVIPDPRIELHPTGFDNLCSRSGIQHAELNAHQASDFYQRFCTVPTTTLIINFSHAKRSKNNNTTPDIMQVLIGPSLGALSVYGTYTAPVNSQWYDHTIMYNVPIGQTDTYFVFRALQGSPATILEGNCVDAISVTTIFDPAYVPSANDNCDNVTITLDVDTIIGNCDYNYQLIRNWTAVDACGNTTRRSQTLTVGDLVAPYFCTPVFDDTITCLDPIPPAPNPMICDSCDLNPQSFQLPDLIDQTPCGASYDIIRRWVMYDECNNRDTLRQVIHVEDVYAPTITCPPDITINCEDDTIPSNTGVPTVTDVCGNPNVYYEDNIIPGACGENYVIERTWYADDTCHLVSCLQIITVVDNTPPVVNCVANDLTLQCDQDYGTEIQDWIDATTLAIESASSDNCGMITVTDDWTGAVPTLDCAGNTGLTVTFTVEDGCGNTTPCSANIYIVDTIA
ncbi:MAG: hypothetical protein KDC80_14995, partial [Saprospiraceae bacterium]|nr:hypothetical protein [Saprospiraceae bacterium]